MRLHCEVEVLSRHLPVLGLKSRGKGVRAVVSLCQPPRRSGLQPLAGAEPGRGACLLVSTMKDKHGTRYQVSDRGALSMHPLPISRRASKGEVTC
ncbi:leucine rich repeat protein 1 [Cricetulus griseus]